MSRMKRKQLPATAASSGKWRLVALCVCVALLCAACAQGPAVAVPSNPISSDIFEQARGLTQYNIHLSFDAQVMRAEGTQQVMYVNTTGMALSELYFHAYPNAFYQEGFVPIEAGDWEEAYPSGFGEGHIDIYDVLVDGQPCQAYLDGAADSLLVVPLSAPLNNGASVTLNLRFDIQVPPCIARFGYGQETINLANFYPVACRFEKGQWMTDPYYAIGDPFTSDLANYLVTLEVPEGYSVATTGGIESVNGRVWTINAPAVRDFACVISDKWVMESQDVGKTTVFSYGYTRKGAREALGYAVAAMGHFNEQFLPYPYRQFSVVQNNFIFGGMEYPNLVMINDKLYDAPLMLEYVVAHETAHQWWYGLVGNDQIREPWLDEALAEYSTLLYFGWQHGETVRQDMYDLFVCRSDDQLLPIYGEPFAPGRPAYEYQDNAHYSTMVYARGAMMLEALCQSMGQDKFMEALRLYAGRMCFKNAAKADFIDALEKVSGEDWTPFVNTHLMGRKAQ